MKICIEGNIGSGKSSALEHVATVFPNLRLAPEPVDEWTDLMDAFYDNPTEWGFAFNLRVMLSFVAPGRCAEDIVIERSPSACRHVFGQLLYNDGSMTAKSWDLFKQYADELGWEPDLFIYIHTPVDTCASRIAVRGRASEVQGITKEYLSRIEFQYENMLRFTKVPVVRIDGDRPPAEVHTDVCKAIADFLG